ncbi:MAG: hypothetical protein ACOYOB_17735 [Myxococcota bacterium]
MRVVPAPALVFPGAAAWSWVAVALALALVACSTPTDAATADAVGSCPTDTVACDGKCLTACELAAERKLEWGCLCLDPTEPVPPQLPSVGQRLGISVVLPSGSSPKVAALRAFIADELVKIGVRVVRTDLRWDDIEPQPGQFQWQEADQTVQELTSRGLRVIGLLAYGNPWASVLGNANSDPYYPPDDPQDFAKFAAAVAARYQGTVTDWEIWNEQNAGWRFWKNPASMSGVPKDYAALLKATHTAIHAVAPAAVVSFGGLFYLPQAILGAEEFATQAFAAVPDPGASFETFSYHPYSAYPPRDPPEFAAPAGKGNPERYAIDDTARRLDQLLFEHTGTKKPLWITELGWPTEAAISELDHARFLVRAWVLALSVNVEVLCWYTFMDHPPESESVLWEKVFGLYRYDGDVLDGTVPQPKPAAIAHRSLAHFLGNLGWSADESTRSTARRQHAFASADLSRAVHVAWDETVPEGQTVAAWFPARPNWTYRLALSTDPPPADDLTLPVLQPDAEGRLQLQVGRTPVYVVGVRQVSRN